MPARHYTHPPHPRWRWHTHCGTWDLDAALLAICLIWALVLR